MSHTPTDQDSLGIDRRFKLSRACDRCRRRRIKCDEGHPCKSCSTSHSPCTFDEIGKKSLPHKSKRSTLEERMQQIESFIQALPSGIFDRPELDGVSVPPELKTSSSTSSASFAQQQQQQQNGSNGNNGMHPSLLSPQHLVNPSQFFTSSARPDGYEDAGRYQFFNLHGPWSSYLYMDDQGATRWQGEMSGFPLLDLLIERETAATEGHGSDSPAESFSHHPSPTTVAGGSDIDGGSAGPAPSVNGKWFPDRTSIIDPARPHDIWMMIGGVISPDLMDHLVLLFLKTTYFLFPILHIPSFLTDYPNPSKWDTSFGCFIVAVCCISSRHVDDIRVRSNPSDAFSAGSHYFDLFLRLRALPGADRPTLYGVQAVLLAAVYAIGRGKLSKGLALLSESITLSIDAGLHRSVEHWDHFDPIETEVRKRTFWSVYSWDKQAAVYFGRPPLIRLRDCDVPEPALVDDEFITKDGIGVQPSGRPALMGAFVATNRLYVILEGVLDVHPIPRLGAMPPDFLTRAQTALSGFRQSKDLKECEALIEDWCRLLPPYWAVTGETMASRDVIRITQAERLHCLEHFARMLIHRYRFQMYVANPSPATEQQKEAAIRGATRSALQIIAKHLEISSLGLMTYYGLFVIHQLTQAGRTLIAILLECRNEGPFTASSLEALKACVGLLRRFSGRYVCGLRSADLLEETCRLNKIPLELYENPAAPQQVPRPAWLRPVRKRMSSRPAGSDKAPSPANAPMDANDPVFRSLFDSPGQANLGAGMDMSGQSYSTQLLTNTGGLVEPLTQGSLAPLTADMFGGQDVSDLLAYLGGPDGAASTSPNGAGDVNVNYAMAGVPMTQSNSTSMMYGGGDVNSLAGTNGLMSDVQMATGATPLSSIPSVM